MKDTNKDSKKLLLIDDDPNLILLVKDYLEFRGYEVITAENGRDAMDVLSRQQPDMRQVATRTIACGSHHTPAGTHRSRLLIATRCRWCGANATNHAESSVASQP